MGGYYQLLSFRSNIGMMPNIQYFSNFSIKTQTKLSDTKRTEESSKMSSVRNFLQEANEIDTKKTKNETDINENQSKDSVNKTIKVDKYIGLDQAVEITGKNKKSFRLELQHDKKDIENEKPKFSFWRKLPIPNLDHFNVVASVVGYILFITTLKMFYKIQSYKEDIKYRENTVAELRKELNEATKRCRSETEKLKLTT